MYFRSPWVLVLKWCTVFILYGCVSAQKTASQSDSSTTRKSIFTDNDIEKYIPLFEPLENNTVVNLSTKTKTKDKLPPPQTDRLQYLADSITQSNKKLRYKEGFRIVVYSGTDKEQANLAKEKVYKIIPNADIYTQFRQPIYRVKVGDYSDRLEAYRVKEKVLGKAFPNAIVIAETVNIKRP